ncbi:nucleotidyltransferase family protein [Catenovulum sediminis]|uniref:nucleotidyltransferase family protein n=1 Tax=Catenovulum sediminis TaxID=1740262 RepID=UPI00117F09A8|nr:nucleotidyltransferase family protein [Catenovulum sediminis]
MAINTAILLAAGLGSRLQPLTNSVPKCLVPIAGKPLLYYWFDNLIAQGIKNIYVNTYYLADKVRLAINLYAQNSYITVVDEAELAGTAGSVKNIVSSFNLVAEDVLIAHADNLCFCDWEDFFNFHLERDRHIDVTMMAFHTDSPQTCGILELYADKRIKAFHEKVDNPPGNLANGAVYLFSEKALVSFLNCSLTKPDISLDIIPTILERIHVWENTTYLRDIGNPNAYAKAQKDVYQFI